MVGESSIFSLLIFFDFFVFVVKKLTRHILSFVLSFNFSYTLSFSLFLSLSLSFSLFLFLSLSLSFSWPLTFNFVLRHCRTRLVLSLKKPWWYDKKRVVKSGPKTLTPLGANLGAKDLKSGLRRATVCTVAER